MLLIGDRALLDGFRRGDRASLERVYTEYVGPVAALLRRGFTFNSGGRRCQYRGARSQFDLEDRLHDVFARAFGEPARLSYDGLSPYKAYILAIARNMVIDDFRRKEHVLVEFTVEPREPEPVVPSPAGEPLAGALEPTGHPAVDSEAAELIALVRAFKEGLPEREREVFRLRFEEEREHKDIAAATGMTPSKIKTSEQRIRERFFDYMHQRGYFAGLRQGRRGWLSGLLKLRLSL
jgi:RNA polymerase sigma-70 factor (ECF subfamily)